MKKNTILVVEDDLEIKTLIQFFLEKENFNVITAQNSGKALEMLQNNKPELVILDIMLPGLNGLEIAKLIKKESHKYGTPFIFMLTAKTETEDVIDGFKAGCDDYLRKPFDPRELILRIKKLLSLKKEGFAPEKESGLLRYDQIEIDLDKHTVTENNSEIILSNKEFRLLAFLIQNKGLALSRETILSRVWNENYHLGDRTIDVYVGKIREKLPSISKNIKTIKGVGYRLKEI